jgi:hypothetical protein
MRTKNWDDLLLPLVLVATGTLVLAGANLGLVSLDRVQDLWPAAIVLVGLVELFSDESAKERGQHD